MNKNISMTLTLDSFCLHQGCWLVQCTGALDGTQDQYVVLFEHLSCLCNVHCPKALDRSTGYMPSPLLAIRKKKNFNLIILVPNTSNPNFLKILSKTFLCVWVNRN